MTHLIRNHQDACAITMRQMISTSIGPGKLAIHYFKDSKLAYFRDTMVSDATMDLEAPNRSFGRQLSQSTFSKTDTLTGKRLSILWKCPFYRELVYMVIMIVIFRVSCDSCVVISALYIT